MTSSILSTLASLRAARRALLCVAIVGLVAASVSSANGAGADTDVSLTVVAVTELDTTACTGAALALGPVSQTSATITPQPCEVDFGGNSSSMLRVYQSDGTGSALTNFNPSAVLQARAPTYFGAATNGATEAWLVGEAGVALDPTPIKHTTDGGISWTSQTSCAVSTALNSVDHVTGGTVVAVGAAGVVCRTTDSGATWNRITPPGTPNVWRGVDVLPSGAGWIVGSSGRVMHTTDAGLTWAALPTLPASWRLQSIAAASSAKLYAVATNYAASNDVIALSSSDGGLTWSSTILDSGPNTWGIDLAALNLNRAVVGTRAGKYLTTDGGATWNLQDATNALCLVAFDSTTVVGFSSPGLPHRRSTDGGVTWSSIVGTPADTGQLRACTAGSTTQAVIAGYNSQIWTTTDAGQTYGAQASGYFDQYAVAAWSADRYLSVGDQGTIRRTLDGGATITQPASGTVERLYDVELGAGGVAVAVGAGGTIVRSTDGGATWGAVASGTVTRLNAVDRAADGTMCATLFSGGVLCSEDDGASWDARTAPSAQRMWDIVVFNEDDLWVSGTGGEIHRSDDGGISWTTQTSSTTLDVISIHSIDGQHAIAVTATDNFLGWGLLRTSNGGATWTATNQPSNTRANVVRYVNDDTVVISTDTGYQYSTDGGATFTSHTVSTHMYGLAALDPHSFVLVGQSDAIARVAPAVTFGDYDLGANDFSGSSSVFGSCLESATGVASTTWPEAGAGNCTGGNLANWRGIATSIGGPTAEIADATGDDGHVELRFGAKMSPSQPAGRYSAHITFEVMAP